MGESEGSTRKRAAGFLSLPTTSIGKWSAGLLLLSLVMVLLNTIVVMPVTEQRAGLELAQTLYNAVTGMCVVASGVSGLFALVMKRERSWVVVVAVLVFASVIALMLQDLATPR